MYKSEQGVTLVELLITMAIVSVILTGAYSSFLSSSKRLVLQNDIVEMQTDARAAMDFMVRELRLAYGVPIDSGCSSGSNTTTTLKDVSKNWSASPPFNTSYYVPPFDPSYYVYYVRIISGTGQSQARSISSNTSTQLTIASPWSTTPNNTSCYVIISSPSISTRVTTNDTIRFYRLEDAGYSSCTTTTPCNTTTTLNDTTKHWSTFDGPSSYTVRIISGTGAGQTRTLSSNTSTQLTVSSAWNTNQTPDTTSFYVITRNRAFTRTSTSDNILRYIVGGSGAQPLADLIASHSFSSDPNNPNTISITLTAQARNAIDPNTKQKRQYTFTETVLKRN